MKNLSIKLLSSETGQWALRIGAWALAIGFSFMLPNDTPPPPVGG